MKKIISILLAVLIIGCFGIDAKTTKKSGKKKSSSSKIIDNKVNNDRYNTQTSIPGMTSFTIDSKEVRIPDLNSFQPLLKLFPKTSKKIKSIKIYYMSPEAGLGTLDEDLKPFKKAKTINVAQKYATSCIVFEFNRNQQIKMYDYSFGTNSFNYDNDGHPISIIQSEWGYRGSPIYTINYKISWQGDSAKSITRDIIEFESEYEEPDEETLPFDLDFATDCILEDVISMLKSKTTKCKTIGNTCRISGKTTNENNVFEIGENVVYWVEIEYY